MTRLTPSQPSTQTGFPVLGFFSLLKKNEIKSERIKGPLWNSGNIGNCLLRRRSYKKKRIGRLETAFCSGREKINYHITIYNGFTRTNFANEIVWSFNAGKERSACTARKRSFPPKLKAKRAELKCIFFQSHWIEIELSLAIDEVLISTLFAMKIIFIDAIRLVFHTKKNQICMIALLTFVVKR